MSLRKHAFELGWNLLMQKAAQGYDPRSVMYQMYQGSLPQMGQAVGGAQAPPPPAPAPVPQPKPPAAKPPAQEAPESSGEEPSKPAKKKRAKKAKA